MGTKASRERISEIMGCIKLIGKKRALIAFGLNEETFNRYVRLAKEYGIDGKASSLAADIIDKFSPSELRAIVSGSALSPYEATQKYDFTGTQVKIGSITDTHLGSKYSNPFRIEQVFDCFRREKVDIVTHSGDVSEGMSNRPGHVYELTHIGYEAQKALCIKTLSQWTDTDIYLVDGNHDRWFIKACGANIVQDVCAAIPNAVYLGHDVGHIRLSKNVRVDLWHGEDGSSYATSYRIQKIVESMPVGDKPQLLLCGHTHKQIMMFERNVHCFSCGSVESQSAWMRSKRLPAHEGFWIITLTIGKAGITRCAGEWFPFYD